MPKPPAKFFKEEHLNRLVAGKPVSVEAFKPMTLAEASENRVFHQHSDFIGKVSVNRPYLQGRLEAMVAKGELRDAAIKGLATFAERHFATIVEREAPELITGRPDSRLLAEILAKHGANEVYSAESLPAFRQLIANTLRFSYLDALSRTLKRLPRNTLKDAPASAIASKLASVYQKKAPHNARADIMMVDVLRKYKLLPMYTTLLYTMPTPTKAGISFLSSELKARGLRPAEITHALRLVRHPNEWA